MDMSEIKRMLTEQGTAFEEYKKHNDKVLDGKLDKLSGEVKEKHAKLEADLGRIDEIKTRVDLMEKEANRPKDPSEIKAEKDFALELKQFNGFMKAHAKPGAVVKDLAADEYTAYCKAFEVYTRKSRDGMTQDEIKAMQAGFNPDGGYLLPSPQQGRTIAKVYELSPFRSMASVVSISGNSLEGIEDNDEAGAGWVSELATRPDTSTPQVGRYTIDAHEMYAQPKASQTILDDAAIDVEAWLSDKVANKFARVEQDAFLNGNGAGKPKGLFQVTTAATVDASRSWGTFEHIVTGTSANWSAQPDVLWDLFAAFKTHYLAGAEFLTNRQVLAALRKLKESTTNAYIWQPGLSVNVPDRLVGYPIRVDQNVPALASGSLSLAFGNFKEAYTIVDRIGIRTLRDPYTDKPYVKFYSTRRVGGAPMNSEAVKFLKFST